jgi:single-strand DNA-binding protein
MNSWNGIGRLTKDPETRTAGAENTQFTNFTIAVNRRFKKEGQPDANFIPVVCIAKTAEFASNYFKKGMQVGVTGEIQTRSWSDDQNVKHYVTEIVAEKIYFADTKKDETSNTPVISEDELPY